VSSPQVVTFRNFSSDTSSAPFLHDEIASYPSPLPLRTSTAPQTSFRELERLGLGFVLFGEAIVFPPPSESLFPFRLESLFPGKGDGFDREIERKRERGRRRRGRERERERPDRRRKRYTYYIYIYVCMYVHVCI